MLCPTFSREHATALHHSMKMSIALDGTKYLPGIVGLNNIKVWGSPCNRVSKEVGRGGGGGGGGGGVALGLALTLTASWLRGAIL